MKDEAKAYAIKLKELAEVLEDLEKSKNGRYEFCGDLGGADNKIHIFNGLVNLAIALGIERLYKAAFRDDAYEFEYLGYRFFQIFSKNLVEELGDMVWVEELQDRIKSSDIFIN